MGAVAILLNSVKPLFCEVEMLCLCPLSSVQNCSECTEFQKINSVQNFIKIIDFAPKKTAICTGLFGKTFCTLWGH